MITIERNTIRKIFYSGSIIIMLLLVVILTGLFSASLRGEYERKIEQLKESIISSKKKYIKDNVSLIFQEIDIEKQFIRKRLQADADKLSTEIKKYLDNKKGKKILFFP